MPISEIISDRKKGYSVKHLKCIVFDMDGTLTQTNQLIFDSFNYIAKKYAGKTYTVPEIIAMFGPPEEEALLSIVSPEQIDSVMKDYLSFYRKHHNQLAQIYPGMENILRSIKESGKTLALFTGKGTPTAMITLQEFHIEKYFDYVVTGNDVVKRKPSSEGLLKIMDHFALQPDELLMVGDSDTDVKAAHEAGVKIAAVVWDSYAKDKVLQMRTDFVFNDTKEFQNWLNVQFN
jgi:HAD superfamily hydrolase (TIGR01509 family)